MHTHTEDSFPVRRTSWRRIAFSSAVVFAVACSGDRATGPATGGTAVTTTVGVPPGWQSYPTLGYTVGLDHSTHHGGSAAGYLNGSSFATAPAVSLEQVFAATAYRGRRLRWSAWVRQVGISGAGAALTMIVESPGQVTGYDDMKLRLLKGTADWHQVSVVLDVPSNAIGIDITATLAGAGTLFVDDARLDVVGTDVATTNTLTAPQASTQDPLGLAAAYALGGNGPTNLDFEGFSPPAQSTVDWLSRRASALTTTDPVSSLDDLQPLKQMVGGAHLVGLGEGTHGTREFFQMKHRILETLVRDMGFTVFAIEATSPEADDMNRYVLTGQGDPHVLLSRLRFWTWNTQEVFDMVQWMRGWNASAPAAQRVQFLGFDMQFPGEAMDSVQSFVTRVHQADSAYVATRFYCMNPFRNRGDGGADLTAAFYAEKTSAADRAACAQGLQEVYDLISADIQKYPTAAPADTFQLRLHDARLVQQFERMIAVENVGSSAVRDRSMAENIQWIRSQAGPSARIALWAHNGHINKTDGFMGGYLRDAYGSDYVSLGFLFAEGAFNAVGLNGGGLKVWRTSTVPPNSIEASFAATNKSGLLFDARQIASGGAPAASLAGPLPMRSIGSGFDTAADGSYFGPITLPGTFDLLVYLRTTTASTLLPFVYK